MFRLPATVRRYSRCQRTTVCTPDRRLVTCFTHMLKCVKAILHSALLVQVKRPYSKFLDSPLNTEDCIHFWLKTDSDRNKSRPVHVFKSLLQKWSNSLKLAARPAREPKLLSHEKLSRLWGGGGGGGVGLCSIKRILKTDWDGNRERRSRTSASSATMTNRDPWRGFRLAVHTLLIQKKKYRHSLSPTYTHTHTSST